MENNKTRFWYNNEDTQKLFYDKRYTLYQALDHNSIQVRLFIGDAADRANNDEMSRIRLAVASVMAYGIMASQHGVTDEDLWDDIRKSLIECTGVASIPEEEWIKYKDNDDLVNSIVSNAIRHKMSYLYACICTQSWHIYAETYLEQHPEVLVTYHKTQKPII